MWRRALSLLGLIAYAGAVGVLFVLSAYTAFGLFVRRGEILVPDVVGLTESEAASALADAGFRYGVREQAAQFSDQVPPGHVLRQTPRADSLAKRSSEVQLVLSLGPELRSAPDLTGRALRAAQVLLGAAGLSAGSTRTIFASRGLPGTVVFQDPPPGAEVGRSAQVELYVAGASLRETWVMPDLVYRPLEQVRRFFERRGFRLGSVKPEPYEGVGSGIVLRQFPLAGHPLRRQDLISLVVSSGAEPGASESVERP